MIGCQLRSVYMRSGGWTDGFDPRSLSWGGESAVGCMPGLVEVGWWAHGWLGAKISKFEVVSRQLVVSQGQQIWDGWLFVGLELTSINIWLQAKLCKSKRLAD